MESGLNHRATETGLTPRYAPPPPRKSSRVPAVVRRVVRKFLVMMMN